MAVPIKRLFSFFRGALSETDEGSLTDTESQSQVLFIAIVTAARGDGQSTLPDPIQFSKASLQLPLVEELPIPCPNGNLLIS